MVYTDNYYLCFSTNLLIMSTTITNPTMCAWCKCWMHRGEKCWTLKTGKFNEHIHKLLTSICNARSNNIGPGLKLHLLSFIITPPTWRFQAYCTDCGLFDIKFSRSGRTIVAPMRLQDETYVSGSGFSGCDHYDGGYDCGAIDGQREWASNANLTGFIVDESVEDNTMNCKQEISESDEDEWTGSDSDEEEFDSDMDWD